MSGTSRPRAPRASATRRRSPSSCRERLIHLYTYENDLVLDPFMGSGTTLLAAAKLRPPLRRIRPRPGLRRHRPRAGSTQAMARHEPDPTEPWRAPARRRRPSPSQPRRATAGRRSDRRLPGPRLPGGQGGAADRRDGARTAGFQIGGTQRCGPVAWGSPSTSWPSTRRARPWNFDVTGAFTTTRGGLLRTDSVWKALGQGAGAGQQRLRHRSTTPYTVPSCC